MYPSKQTYAVLEIFKAEADSERWKARDGKNKGLRNSIMPRDKPTTNDWMNDQADISSERTVVLDSSI